MHPHPSNQSPALVDTGVLALTLTGRLASLAICGVGSVADAAMARLPVMRMGSGYAPACGCIVHHHYYYSWAPCQGNACCC